MSSTVIIAIISLIGTMFGSLVGVIASSSKTIYRIEELEKKVDKHNNVIERVALLEQNEDTQWKRIDELKESIAKYHG